jgi:hypothetical protein
MNESNILNLCSIAVDMLSVYAKLHDVLLSAGENTSSVKLLQGSIKAKFVAESYFGNRKSANMKGLLSTFPFESCMKIARLESNMFRSVSAAKKIGNGSKFSEIESLLPSALIEIANCNPKHEPRLLMLSKRLSLASSNLSEAMMSIDKPSKTEKPKKDSVVSQQNAIVESIINETLSKIDKKVAHRIRTILSKSDNKLETLRLELSKV